MYWTCITHSPRKRVHYPPTSIRGQRLPLVSPGQQSRRGTLQETSICYNGETARNDAVTTGLQEFPCTFKDVYAEIEMIEDLRDSVTPTKAAQMLGVHLGTIHRWMINGVRGRILPSVLVGGRRRIMVGQLEAFLSQGGTQSGNVSQQIDDTTERHQNAQNRLRSFGVRSVANRKAQ